MLRNIWLNFDRVFEAPFRLKCLTIFKCNDAYVFGNLNMTQGWQSSAFHDFQVSPRTACDIRCSLEYLSGETLIEGLSIETEHANQSNVSVNDF